MIKINVYSLLIASMLVDIYSTKCPSLKRVKVLGHRKRITVLGVSTGELDPSFYMIPTIQYAEDSNCRTCETLSNPLNTSIYGVKTCPNSTSGEPDSCPHYLEINYDPYRIPESIAQAKCNCPHCRIITPRGTLTTSSDGVCKEVEVYRQVLRQCKHFKKESNKTRTRRKYVMRYEKYPVACTCKLATAT